MKFLFSLFSISLLLFTSLSPALAQPTAGFWPSKKSEEFAVKMVKKMTVEEKVGQLVHVGINAKFANQNSPFFKDLQRHVVENKVGGIIFFGAPLYETTVLANRMQQNAKLPLLMSLDAETGIGMRFEDATNFPWAMAVAATGNPEFARRMGVITGREAKAIGIRHVYAPVLDVNNNADNPVINVRSFGESPEDVANFGVAFAQGVQSQQVIATAKHFPGHGDTNVDSHRGLPIIELPKSRLDSLELFPFKKAIESGIGSIMIAHISLPQIDGEEVKPLRNFIQGDAEQGAEIVNQKATIPATLSGKVQTGILRNEMGFKGLIVSDAMSMSGLTIYFSQEEAGVRAFLAGTDILEKPADVDAMIRGIVTAVNSGRIPMQKLDDSVRRQIAWKHELGLFKDRMTAIDQMDKLVAGSDTLALTDEIATKAITLVRSESGVLPVDRKSRIAVFGVSNGFDGPPTMNSLVSTLRANNVRITPAYLQENSTVEQALAARQAVNAADVVIVSLYGRVRSGARNSVGIPENGAVILRDLLASNKKVIAISFGNPYILSSFPELKTYLVAYGDMPSLQRAVARSLLGMQEITGKLPISLPKLHARGTGIEFSPGVKVMSARRPAFPALARVADVTRDVTIEVSIRTDGTVASSRIVSGDPLLNEASIAASKKFRFVPSLEDTIRTSVIIFRFKARSDSSPTESCCDRYPYVVSVN